MGMETRQWRTNWFNGHDDTRLSAMKLLFANVKSMVHQDYRSVDGQIHYGKCGVALIIAVTSGKKRILERWQGWIACCAIVQRINRWRYPEAKQQRVDIARAIVHKPTIIVGR